MSLVITGTNLTLVLILLVGLNGFFCYKKMPLLGIPIAGLSVVFLIGFNIEVNGLSILLSIMLIIFIFASLVVNIDSYRRKK